MKLQVMKIFGYGKKIYSRFDLNPLIQGKDSLTGLHANTQIPKIIGAAEIYEQNPEKYADYKKACENFWNYVVNNRSYAIGGNSIAEHFEAEVQRHLELRLAKAVIHII